MSSIPGNNTKTVLTSGNIRHSEVESGRKVCVTGYETAVEASSELNTRIVYGRLCDTMCAANDDLKF